MSERVQKLSVKKMFRAVQHERDRNFRTDQTSCSPTPMKIKKPTQSIESQTDVTLSSILNYSGPPSSRKESTDNIMDLPSPYCCDSPEDLIAAQIVYNERRAFTMQDEILVNPDVLSRRADISFQVAFLNPSLVSHRYPMEFLPTSIMTADLLMLGWRRHFIYYMDWIRTFDEFKALCLADQLILARCRHTDHGWFMHSYHTMLCGRYGICLANGGFHPHSTDHQWAERDKIIGEFYESQTKTVTDHLIIPMKDHQVDFTEYVMLKAIFFFREEPGMTPEGTCTVKEARKKYLRTLYKYIKGRHSADEKSAWTKFSTVLSFATVLTALKSMFDDRIMMNHFFKIMEFDGLILDVHNGDLNSVP
ncbi:hypothetical protein FO519_002150 [Halicephalobus sp. NKZ332]|nr:hypothetical protein FO519_002150 [Halicephalobus sp. NKZ332]